MSKEKGKIFREMLTVHDTRLAPIAAQHQQCPWLIDGRISMAVCKVQRHLHGGKSVMTCSRTQPP